MVKLPEFEISKGDSTLREGIYEALKEHNEKESRDYVRDVYDPRVLRVSSIGDCPRKNWGKRDVSKFHKKIGQSYRRQQPAVKDTIGGRTVSIFKLGDKIEELVIEHLRLAGHDVFGEQTEVSFDVDNVGSLVGHIDGISSGDDGYGDLLLEVKSANDNQFNRCVEMGYEQWNAKYSAQIHCYMAGTELDMALAVVYNKNTSEIYCEIIRYDEDVFLQCIENARLIFNKRFVPPRPEEARTKSCFYCKWCDINEWCWGPNAETDWSE